jgi:tRNA (guanosine-2'-O-)-methyltransferase
MANRQTDLHVVIEDVGKERNVSSIMRTCEAVGVGRVHVICTDGAEQAVSPTISKGAEQWLEVDYYDEPGTCLARLALAGVALYCTGLDARARSFRDIDYIRPCAIVLGNEVGGVSATHLELADEVIMIPIMGLVQSLNVGAAAAVVLYEAQRQRAEAGMYVDAGLSPVKGGLAHDPHGAVRS